MKHSILAVSVVAIGMSACARNNNANPLEHAAAVAKDPGLQEKVFESACSDKLGEKIMDRLKTGFQAKGHKEQYQFAGANVTRRMIYYANNDCTGDASFTVEERGTVDIKDGQKTSDDARFLDITYSEAHGVMNSSTSVDAANTVKACGVADWAVGQDRDITAHAKDATCPAEALPRKDYQVYRLEGNTLFLGDVSKRDDTGRPTSIDRQQKYTAKQSGGGSKSFQEQDEEVLD